jgi:hypothetical protein
MIERGEPWGEPTDQPADIVVRGGDGDLADAVRERPGSRVGFEADASSDLARAVGLVPGGATGPGESAMELPLDVLALDNGVIAVNAVVLGAPPAQLRWTTLGTALIVEVDGRTVFDGRATTVVVANGEYLDGQDLVPRGHPGDGRAEVQVYALARGQRRAMRRRLAEGTHVPHPGIVQAAGRVVAVRAPAGLPLLAAGRPRGSPEDLRVEVRPAGCRLVVGAPPVR